MITTHALLSRGLFPFQLPPCFTSEKFADFCRDFSSVVASATNNLESNVII
jgi:hypothetical protein